MKRFLALAALALLAGCSPSVPDTITPEQAEPALQALLNHQVAFSGSPARVENLQVSACAHQGPAVICEVSLTFRGEAFHRRAAFRPFNHDPSRFAAIWMPK